jgi:hypothetical protein
MDVEGNEKDTLAEIVQGVEEWQVGGDDMQVGPRYLGGDDQRILCPRVVGDDQQRTLRRDIFLPACANIMAPAG